MGNFGTFCLLNNLFLTTEKLWFIIFGYVIASTIVN